MKKTILIIALFIGVFSYAQDTTSQTYTDSIAEAYSDSVTQATLAQIYAMNIQTMVSLFEVAFGSVDVNADTLQTFLSRDNNSGDWYMFLAGKAYLVPTGYFIAKPTSENITKVNAIEQIPYNYFKIEKKDSNIWINKKRMPNMPITNE